MDDDKERELQKQRARALAEQISNIVDGQKPDAHAPEPDGKLSPRDLIHKRMQEIEAEKDEP